MGTRTETDTNLCTIYSTKGWCQYGSYCKKRHLLPSSHENPESHQLNAILGIQQLLLKHLEIIENSTTSLDKRVSNLESKVSGLSQEIRAMKKELNNQGIAVRLQRSDVPIQANRGILAQAKKVSEDGKRTSILTPQTHFMKGG